MSIAALKWAFRVPVEGPAKGVLLALADHADDIDGRCFPRIDRIEVWAGCRARAVRMAIQRLAEWGLVTVEGPNRYVVNVGATLGESACGAAKPARRATRPVHDVQPKVHDVQPKVHDVQSPIMMNPQRTPKEPPVPPSPPSLELAFDAPRQDIVAEAVAIWCRVCGDVLGHPKPDASERRPKLLAALRKEFQNDLGRWEDFCRKLRGMRFYTGGAPSGWRADIDWALRPQNLRKVLESREAPPNVVPLRPKTAQDRRHEHIKRAMSGGLRPAASDEDDGAWIDGEIVREEA